MHPRPRSPHPSEYGTVRSRSKFSGSSSWWEAYNAHVESKTRDSYGCRETCVEESSDHHRS